MHPKIYISIEKCGELKHVDTSLSLTRNKIFHLAQRNKIFYEMQIPASWRTFPVSIPEVLSWRIQIQESLFQPVCLSSNLHPKPGTVLVPSMPHTLLF
jgi:hypothetical protein